MLNILVIMDVKTIIAMIAILAMKEIIIVNVCIKVDFAHIIILIIEKLYSIYNNYQLKINNTYYKNISF